VAVESLNGAFSLVQNAALPSIDYFPDLTTGCQVFTQCGSSDAFLCPNGTIFDIRYQTCDWWFDTTCTVEDGL